MFTSNDTHNVLYIEYVIADDLFMMGHRHGLFQLTVNNKSVSNISNSRNPTMWYARRDGDSENKDQANQNIKERWGEGEDYIL